MTPDIDLLDAGDLDRLSGTAADPPDDGARGYVGAIVRAGARFYVDNANVRMKALAVGGRLLPLAINEGRGGNADVCSPYAHYVEYTLHELGKRHPRVPPWLVATLAWPARAMLRAGAIDRVVFVNNWLLATNPSHGLTAAQVAATTARLTQAYPDSAIVFRSVNPELDRRGCDALRHNHYRLVRSRRIYLLDPASGQHLEHRDARRDLKLLRQTPYATVRSHEALLPHVSRLAELYRHLYVRKHSRLNPQFNAGFFALTLREHLFSYRALMHDGRIDAFVAFFVQDGVLTGTVSGYDCGLPRKLGLYRLIIAILIAEAAARGLRLNLSAGADRFKMLRGAVPIEECDAVYDRHLALHRRLAWTALMVGEGRASGVHGAAGRAARM